MSCLSKIIFEIFATMFASIAISERESLLQKKYKALRVNPIYYYSPLSFRTLVTKFEIMVLFKNFSEYFYLAIKRITLRAAIVIL